MSGNLENQLKAYFESPTVALRNQLAEANIGLARAVAYTFAGRLDYDDAFSLSSMGLIKGIERYNPQKSKGATTGFLQRYCRGEILHYLRDKDSLIKTPRGSNQPSIIPEKYLDLLATQATIKPDISRYLIIKRLKNSLLKENDKLEALDLETLVSHLAELSA